MAQRDNSFDPAMLDIALRDVPALRDSTRKASAIKSGEIGGIGACDLGKYEDVRPKCYDMDYLDGHYNPDTAGIRSLAAGAVDDITFNPLSDYVCPVAIAAMVWDSADPTLPSVAWFLSANIRGCIQFNFDNEIDTVAGATQFVPSQLWNPFARNCRGCPIGWGIYGNTAHRGSILTVQVANPTATPIDVMLVIWGVSFDCCPGWTDKKNMNNPRDLNGPGVATTTRVVTTTGRPSAL